MTDIPSTSSITTKASEQDVLFSAVGGARTEKESAAAGNQASQKASTGSSGASRKGRGSTITPDYGKRTIQSYPITKAELDELSGLGVAATICFSLASGLFGFAVNISKDLSFNPSLAKEISDPWTYISKGCLVLAFVLVIFGGVAVYRGHSKISQIKSETEFGK